MTLILCHSPTGGVGTTFLAAHLALGLAERGHDVTAIDFTYADALKLFFGLRPVQQLPRMGEPNDDKMVVDGVTLLSGYAMSRAPSFAEAIGSGRGALFGTGRVVIADVASADMELKQRLLPHAALHLCTLMPRPASLAALAKIDPGTATIDLVGTAFVLNHVDDTRRLSRHSKIFLSELFGDGLVAAVRRDEAVNEALASFQSIARYAPHSVVLPDLRAMAAAVEQRCDLIPAESAE